MSIDKNFWIRKNDRPNLILAPMASYTDSAFRLLCKEFGADIVMTELVSADAIFHNKKIKNKKLKIKNIEKDLFDSDKTLSLMRFDQRERPIVVQLFGKYPEKFAYAAKWVVDNIKPDGIDINMGCPARKVVGSDHGAALLKNHNLAVEIVRAVREQIQIPLSVKTRLGWGSDDEILQFAPKLVKAGVDAIIIHGRTYKDGFRNIARWENIYRLKSEFLKTSRRFALANVGIPTEASGKNYKLKAIIGNGDIRDYKEAIDKSESEGIKLDGVAIGRAAFGNPWIFSPNKSRCSDRDPDISESSGLISYSLIPCILRHAELCYEKKGDHGIIEFRKHLLAYTKGLPNAKELRRQAVKIETIEDAKAVLENIIVV